MLKCGHYPFLGYLHNHLTFWELDVEVVLEVFMKLKNGLMLGAVLGLATTRMALADPTALQLVKNGDNYVGIQSKDKILEIFSDKSVAMLQPNVWHVVYYDPDVTFKSVDVKFGAGQEMEVTHPLHAFGMPAKASDILDQSKVSVDSDRALGIATSQPLLKGLTLRSSKMALDNGDSGPTWKVELYAAKVSDPTKEVSVGSVWISATDGSLIKLDLHPSDAS
jgi:hypothetical protein